MARDKTGILTFLTCTHPAIGHREVDPTLPRRVFAPAPPSPLHHALEKGHHQKMRKGLRADGLEFPGVGNASPGHLEGLRKRAHGGDAGDGGTEATPHDDKGSTAEMRSPEAGWSMAINAGKGRSFPLRAVPGCSRQAGTRTGRGTGHTVHQALADVFIPGLEKANHEGVFQNLKVMPDRHVRNPK